jgi:hypothetical protein
VEVGWRMIIVMHRNHDSEELADAGQSRWRAKATAGGVATLPRPRGAGMARSGMCPAAWIAWSRGARGAGSGRGLYRDRTIGGPGRVTALIATALRSWSAGRS